MQEKLTQREQEIFEMLLEGKSPKEIGFNLSITLSAVRFHQQNIYKKLNVNNYKELRKKFSLPNNAQTRDGHNDVRQKKLPLTFIVLAAIAVFFIAIVFVWNLSQKNKEVFVFEHWIAFSDDNSEIQLSVRNEEIDGRNIETISIFGRLHDTEIAHAGTYGRPNDKTLNLLRTARAFSFSFQGDGGRYYMRLPTFETIEGDHWLIIFPTVKDEISSVTFNIPDDLFRFGWSGKDAEFIRENIMFIQVQPVDPGDYRLKFWDIKLHQ